MERFHIVCLIKSSQYPEVIVIIITFIATSLFKPKVEMQRGWGEARFDSSPEVWTHTLCWAWLRPKCNHRAPRMSRAASRVSFPNIPLPAPWQTEPQCSWLPNDWQWTRASHFFLTFFFLSSPFSSHFPQFPVNFTLPSTFNIYEYLLSTYHVSDRRQDGGSI